MVNFAKLNTVYPFQKQTYSVVYVLSTFPKEVYIWTPPSPPSLTPNWGPIRGLHLQRTENRTIVENVTSSKKLRRCSRFWETLFGDISHHPSCTCEDNISVSTGRWNFFLSTNTIHKSPTRSHCTPLWQHWVFSVTDSGQCERWYCIWKCITVKVTHQWAWINFSVSKINGVTVSPENGVPHSFKISFVLNYRVTPSMIMIAKGVAWSTTMG